MGSASPTIREIARALETWAPRASAQSYDNVGLQVGDPDVVVRRALIALDMTPAVLAEARTRRVDLIITHHPLIFRPLRTVTADDLVGSLALRLAEARIALYSIHTNLDAAHDGVSFGLAEHLGLSDIRFLDHAGEQLLKLATYVPKAHAEQVRDALAEAGTGRIGNYEACAFLTEGTSYFRPKDATSPFIGQAGGDLEAVPEVKLEVLLARWDLGRVLRALEAAHPYEEVAYDVYRVEQAHSRIGLGAIGHLDPAEPLSVFLDRVATRLNAASLKYVGDLSQPIQKVAVCGGSGSDYTRTALRAGADAYVTADITYHRFFEVLNTEGVPEMAVIDAGHYETEALTETLLQSWLSKGFPDTVWSRTQTRTSPINTFVSSSKAAPLISPG